MAWIYLAALEGLQSPLANGLTPSPIAKLMPFVKESSSVVYPTDHSIMHQFGIISRRSPMMGEIGPKSTSFMEVSPVRTSVLQEMEKAWKESAVAYFSRSFAWPKKSSPLLYSLKMCQQLPHGEGFESLEKLPKWGMIVGGVLYPLRPLEHYTKEKDGFFWPTPCARDCRTGKRKDKTKLRKCKLCEEVG